MFKNTASDKASPSSSSVSDMVEQARYSSSQRGYQQQGGPSSGIGVHSNSGQDPLEALESTTTAAAADLLV